MMKFLFLAASALTLLPMTAASAQDASSGDSLFSGPFVGGQVGWGHRTTDGAGIHDSRDGVDYGGYAGYDATVGGRFVIGAEGDIGAGGKTLRESIAGVGTTSIDPSWNWNVSGRAGFLATPQLLFYGRVGYGEERVRERFISAAATPSFGNRDWLNGAVYGGGVEYAVTPKVSVRAEYRYSDFDGSYNPQQALLGVSFRF